MRNHIVTEYDQDLEALDQKIAEMGGIAEKMLSDSMAALSNFDMGLARTAIDSDLRLDQLQRELEERAILTIAKRQPMADDLREVIATIRISNDLERVGDFAKNIAQRVVKISRELRTPRCIVGLRSMYEVASTLLTDALDAYARCDAQLAREVWTCDVELDDLEDLVFRDLLTFMMEDRRNISFCAHLLFCAKNIERVGDHATNIAETVIYLVTGEAPPIERPKGRGAIKEAYARAATRVD